MSDLRYGLRLLRRQPGFAAVAILTMALGIGATTVLFSVASGVLFGAVGPIDISAVPELQAITAEVRPAIRVRHGGRSAADSTAANNDIYVRVSSAQSNSIVVARDHYSITIP